MFILYIVTTVVFLLEWKIEHSYLCIYTESRKPELKHLVAT